METHQDTAVTQRIAIYDTTLRDGSQGEGVSFSVEDKVRIAHRLDAFGVDYIEGGWPGSNPKDIEFFERMRAETLATAKLAAFGSTRRPGRKAQDDDLLRMLVDAQTRVITIFGKTWDFHVTHALKVSLAENLAMISDTVSFLCKHADEVIFDAEHFFDGYKHNRAYALKALDAAAQAGAKLVVLCDTNGGTLPHEVSEIVADVVSKVGVLVGIHTHDDSGCGIANALAAVRCGACHVQGTINGYGERCGNANLIPVVANLQLKMGYECLRSDSILHLTSVSQFVDETANLAPNTRQAYVGRSAFAHKGGVHVDAVLKHRSTYEHVDPESVGNSRRMLVSELAGGSTIVNKAAMKALDLTKSSPETRSLLKRVAQLESEGYSFEGAEASFDLLMAETLGLQKHWFDALGFRVIVEKRGAEGTITEATVKVSVDGRESLTVAEGDGPIHALDQALRKALCDSYPELSGIWLTDFKVRVINTREGTAAKVRTIIDSTDGEKTWSTVGVSTNMIEASWRALVESVLYGIAHKRTPREATTQED